MLGLEVVPLPVRNIDRSISFYTEQVGFSLDFDYQEAHYFRLVQLTPPGSKCSIQLAVSETDRKLHNLLLVTDDLLRERRKLIQQGVNVSSIRHKEPLERWSGGWGVGLDPQRRDYASFADFTDPDGNTWTLQERGYRAQ
jgi:catechol 2,3-dioxygenase-like lactoylglutathione lyase family enzyme